MLTCSDFSLSSSESSGVSTVVRWSQVLGNHVGRSSVVVGWADCLSNPGFVDVVHQRRRRKQENDQLTILFSSESVSLLRAWFSGELFPLSLLLSFWALFSTQPFRGGEHSWLLKSHWRWRHVELVLEKEGLFCRVSRPSHAVGISWLREKWSSVWLKLQPELRLFYSHISLFCSYSSWWDIIWVWYNRGKDNIPLSRHLISCHRHCHRPSSSSNDHDARSTTARIHVQSRWIQHASSRRRIVIQQLFRRLREPETWHLWDPAANHEHYWPKLRRSSGQVSNCLLSRTR